MIHTTKNPIEESRRSHAFPWLLGASVALSVASIGADQALGIAGIHYLFAGIAFGMWSMIGFYRFTAR